MKKKYRSISEQVIKNLPIIKDWLNEDFLKSNNLGGWNESIQRLHNSDDSKNIKSKTLRRIIFDEICANLLTLSTNRKRVKKK